MTETQTPWKEPQQARSKQRFDHILDVAAELFAEQGFENATTNAIAERAKVPIGSVYQYFGNKEVILQALTARYYEGLHTTYMNAFPEKPESMSLLQLLDATIDPFIQFEIDNPGFGHVYRSAEVSVEVAEATAQLDDAILAQIQRMIQAHLPRMPDKIASMKALVVKTTIKGMMGLISDSQHSEEQRQLLHEAKQLIAGYIEVSGEGYSTPS